MDGQPLLTQSWRFNPVRGSYTSVVAIESKQGCFVYSRRDAQVSLRGRVCTDDTVTLQAGWNLIGPVTACRLPDQHPFELTPAWGFDPVTKSYLPVYGGGELQPGKGYWLYVLQPHVLRLAE